MRPTAIISLGLLAACGPMYTISGEIDAEQGCWVVFQGDTLRAPAATIERRQTEEVPTHLMCGNYNDHGVAIVLSLGRAETKAGQYHVIPGNFGADPKYGTVSVHLPDPNGVAGGMRVRLERGTIGVSRTATEQGYHIRFHGTGEEAAFGH